MPKKKIQLARFKLEDQFHIAGRGLVLAGQIISGHIVAGNSVCIEQGDDLITFEIHNIEVGHSNIPRAHFVGLMLGPETDCLRPLFEKLIGQTLPII